MDIQKIPPIQQKRIVTFVNHFIIDSVSFLNKFINSSESMLWKLEKKMRKLETSLKLLEGKLNFMPLESPQVTVSATKTEEQSNSSNPTPVTKDKLVEIEDSENTSSTENAPVAEIPEELKKYYTMVRVGVHIEAVKIKMKVEGVDPNLLKI